MARSAPQRVEVAAHAGRDRLGRDRGAQHAADERVEHRLASRRREGHRGRRVEVETGEVLRARRRVLDQCVAVLDRELRDRRNALLERINKEVVDIITKIGQEKGYAMILERDVSMLYANPGNDVTQLVIDRYDEDWSALAYLLARGPAALLSANDPEHTRAVKLLRIRYPQYHGMPIDEQPAIVIRVESIVAWGAIESKT